MINYNDLRQRIEFLTDCNNIFFNDVKYAL